MSTSLATADAFHEPDLPLTLHQLIARGPGRVVVLGGSKDPNRKLTILFTADGRRCPLLVVKAPTTDRAETSVLQEARVLCDLEATWPTLKGLPRVMSEVEFDGRRASVMTGLPGIPMSTLYHRWRHTRRRTMVERDFAAVDGWLSSFQLATVNGRGRPTMLDGVTLRLAQRFEDDPSLGGSIGMVEALRNRLSELETFRVAVHGDLWGGNLLVSGEQVLGVVDWEAATLSGDPLRDLVRFALTYSLYLDRHTRPGCKVAGHPGLRAQGWGCGIRYAIEGQGWYPSLVKTFLRRGLRRLGLPPAAWRTAALAGLAEIAVTADDHAFARHHMRLLGRLRMAERGSP
ncbi:MAG: phosphotransferase family protein [Actinomycetota bacterium]